MAADSSPIRRFTGNDPVAASAAALLGIAFLWSYWPELREMVGVWVGDPDYSHGFLVIPIAMYFLVTRWNPDVLSSPRPAVAGVSLIVIAIAIRYLADRFYLYEFAAWTMVPWIAGVCWLLGGRRFFWWSLPAVAFLLFALKVPLRYERALSGPLQSIATDTSSWMLQFIGIPAFSQGNTILIGDERLAVAEACAGLRMCLGVFALAYGFCLIIERPWWQKVAVWLMAAPIAVVANALRIFGTGILYQLQVSQEIRDVGHDLAGLIIIPVAAGLMWGLLWVLSRSVKQVQDAAA